MKVVIINYGMGNLNSVRRAFEDTGANTVIAKHPDILYEATHIVLPGVGSFADGMTYLRKEGWASVLQELVIKQQRPLLGICLGMQMLATSGFEGGESAGLGFISGQVKKLDSLGCKLCIPHIGWNEVVYQRPEPIFEKIPNASDFYFVHSYAFVPEKAEHVIATVPYGLDVVAVVRKEHIFGCQFHPEKSSKAGRQLLKNFMSYSTC